MEAAGCVFLPAAGSAIITATSVDGNFSASAIVTVEKKPLPAGALAGEFTVNSDGKKVHFSKGNLKYNDTSTTWAFYEHQYDCATEYDSNLISLFTWGYDATKSIVPDGTVYVEGHTTDGETFSKAEDWGYVFGGESSIWRTLTTVEWQYLLSYDGSEDEGMNYDNDTRRGKYKCGVTVCNKANCLIIVPDTCLNDYVFDNSKTSYNESEWATGRLRLPQLRLWCPSRFRCQVTIACNQNNKSTLPKAQST